MKRSENINVNSLWQKLTNKVKSDYSTAYKPKLTQNQPPTTGRYNGQIIRAPPPNGMYQQPHINNPRRVPHDIYLPPINNPRRHSQNSYDPPSTSSTEQQEEAEKRRKFWLARIERMNKVLCEFNLQHLAGNFERDDVSVEDVEYLSDGDFIQLGIIRRGDKCRLKRRCIKLTQGMSDKFVFHGEDNYDDLVEEHYKEEEIRPVTATTHKAPTAQATQIVPNDLSSSSSEMQVEMASESRFEMGDKNNVVKTKQIITADYIGTVGQAIGTEETKEHDIERPTSGKVMSENKMTVKMEEHAVFEAGNKNNFIENQLEVTASEINTVGGNLGPSGAGLPGIPGLGGNNIHIALGENAAFNLSNMDNIDIKEKEEPEYFVVNFVDQSKRKPGRLKTKRLREAFKNEFGFFIFQKLLRIYEQLLVEKERPVRIKPKVEREKILDQETWNVKIYDQMMEDTNNELSNLVVLQSNVFTRSTVTGYSSDLLKNTRQYRISNKSALRDVLGMSEVVPQSTPILASLISSPEYSGLLQLRSKLRTASTEYLDTSTHVIGTGVSRGTQTLSSASVETATQTSFNNSEAATQTNSNRTPAVSATAVSTLIHMASSANSTNTPTSLSDVNDASGSKYNDSGVQAVLDNGTSSEQLFIDDQHQTDRRQQSKFSANESITNFQKMREDFDVSTDSLKTSIEKLKRDIDSFANIGSYGYNTQDIEDLSTTKSFDTSSPEYFYSYIDSATTSNNDKSDTSSPEYFYSYIDSATTSNNDKSDTSSPEYFYSYIDSSTTSDNDKSDTSTPEYFYSYIDSPSTNDHDKSDTSTYSSPYKSVSSYEHYYSDVEDSLFSDKDTSSSEQILPPMVGNEYSSSPPPQNTNLPEDPWDMNLSEDTTISSADTNVHLQFSNNSSIYDTVVSSSEHDTPDHNGSPDRQFDIRNLVTMNSFGQFSLDHSTMLLMFGFDPRKSPFVPCGYLNMGNLPTNLDGVVLQDIKRRDITYERNNDNSYNEIGRGTYGVVYLARMKNIENKVVVKEFHHQGMSWEDVEREAQILTYLKGQDITPNFLGVLTSRKKSRAYSLVQEYYGHGTVQDMYLNYDLSPYSWIMICKNICQVLFKIHCNHILFNDLKSDNILVNLNNFDIRFIDFGMSTFRKGIMFEGCTVGLAECLFYAPEVREGCFSTPQSDIYSLGDLFKQIIKYANVYQLLPLYKSCTRIQAIDRPTLPEIMDILDTL